MSARRIISIAILLFLGTTYFAFADAYSIESGHGFNVANCSGGITKIYVINGEWICIVNDYMSNYWQQMKDAGYTSNGGYTYDEGIATYFAAKRIKDGYVYVDKHKYIDDMLYDFGRADLCENVIEQIMDKYLPDVRDDWDLPLNSRNYYAITSPDDSSYSSAKVPTTLGRYIASIGQWLDPESRIYIDDQCHVVNYSWLKLPTKLKSGDRYTVTQDNGLSGNFLYDEDKTVSRAIKINQIGYLPWAPKKYAYCGAWAGSEGPIEFSDITSENFEIINDSNGSTVYTGPIKFRAGPSSTGYLDVGNIGEYVYEMEFSDFNQSGTFYIKIPGVGRSWPFRVNNDVYGEPFYKAMKGIYYQRCGMEVEAQHSAWTHGACHLENYASTICEVDSREWREQEATAARGSGDIGFGNQAEAELWKMRQACVSEDNFVSFDRYPRLKAEWRERLDETKKIADCFGGWHDAADFDRRPYHMVGIFDLMTAFMMNSNNLIDSQCNIIESSNGIPDILDECAWALRTYKSSQRADGGLSTRFESTGHPSYPYHTPEYDPMPFFANYPERQGTLWYAATAGLFSYLVRPFNSSVADEYLASAELAYSFAQNSSNRLQNMSYWYLDREDDHNNGNAINNIFETYLPFLSEYFESYNDEYVWTDFARQEKYEHSQYHSYMYRLKQYRYTESEDFYPADLSSNNGHKRRVGNFCWMAPFNLYLASGKSEYATIVNNSVVFDDFTKFDDMCCYQNFAFVAAFTKPAGIDNDVIDTCKNKLLLYANGYTNAIHRYPYRLVANYAAWGASTQQRKGKLLFQAFAITGDTNYLTTAILANDFMFGCRPGSLLYTTGFGWSYISTLLAPCRNFKANEKIYDPIPGYTSFAPTGNIAHQLNKRSWRWSVGSTTKYYLPAPFNSGTSLSGKVPLWRIVGIFEGNAMCWEYTVNETQTPVAVGTGCLVPSGWTPSTELKNLQPKPKDEVYGYYFLP